MEWHFSLGSEGSICTLCLRSKCRLPALLLRIRASYLCAQLWIKVSLQSILLRITVWYLCALPWIKVSLFDTSAKDQNKASVFSKV